MKKWSPVGQNPENHKIAGISSDLHR